MFNYSHKLSHLFIACTLVASLAGHSKYEEVQVGVENVFVPKGFDSNDNVEIVVNGDLPNTCYLRPHGEVKVVNQRVIVEMKATKVTDRNVGCIEALVPYVVAVPLGALAEGVYDIVINVGSDVEQNRVIRVDRPNSSSINNFTYANVTEAHITNEKRTVQLSGVHPSSCMDIERVEIIVNETNDTFSVLPIIKQVEPICDRMIKPFTYTLLLPEPQASYELVHVRKIDGTALNFIVNETPKHHIP